VQHPIPPTPATVSNDFTELIQKHRLADVMETRELSDQPHASSPSALPKNHKLGCKGRIRESTNLG
jgi:hypothetical protein